MTLKSNIHMKPRHFYNQKDAPFDLKPQLMSADPLPFVKINVKSTSCFALFFLLFLPNDLIILEV